MSRAQMKRNGTDRSESGSALAMDKNVGTVERLASLAGGAALAAYGAKRGSGAGAAIAMVGGALVLRGATGHCPVYDSLGIDTNQGEPDAETKSVLRASNSIRVEHSATINRQPTELFRFWRDFSNLPLFMKNLESVEMIDPARSRWRTKGPLGTTVEWEAEIINESLDDMIAWRSLEGSEVANAGSVHFESAPGGRGTVVRVVMEYHPIGGRLAGLLAKATGTDAQTQIEQDLRRFKSIMEAGEFPTTAGQPQGGNKSMVTTKEEVSR